MPKPNRILATGATAIALTVMGSPLVRLIGVVGLTTGTIFLMWLGEQIDEYGIGNGISLIIMSGIVARLPWAVRDLLSRASLQVTGADSADIGLVKILFLVASFVFVVSGSIRTVCGRHTVAASHQKSESQRQKPKHRTARRDCLRPARARFPS